MTHAFATLPVAVVLVLIGVLVLVESVGIPVPGETALLTAGALISDGMLHAPWWGVAAAAAVGAVVGDSIGYAIGHRWGTRLLRFMVRRFPRHLSPEKAAWAASVFNRWGVLAVGLGRLVALLRMLAGPLSGATRMHYRRFLAANVVGALVWGFGTMYVAVVVGRAVHQYLRGGALLALAAIVLVGLVLSRVLHGHVGALSRAYATEHPDEVARYRG